MSASFHNWVDAKHKVDPAEIHYTVLAMYADEYAVEREKTAREAGMREGLEFCANNAAEFYIDSEGVVMWNTATYGGTGIQEFIDYLKQDTAE